MSVVLNKIPQIKNWLNRRSIQSPWSTCELKLSENEYQMLLESLNEISSSDVRGTSRLRHNQHFLSKPTSDYDWLGFVLTVAMSECGRRESSEGSFWPPIARRFANTPWYRCLFTSADQPTQFCREMLENAARHFNLRHVFGREGGQNWYISLLLQVGFTHRGFARRLPEWLAGAITPLAIEYLLGSEGGLRSHDFCSLWDNLWHYRRCNIPEKTLRDTLKSHASSSWILPGWMDELAHLACERRHLDGLYIGRSGIGTADSDIDDETDNEFLAQPRLVWERPHDPSFKSEFINLKTLILSEPHYVLLIEKREITRLIRQENSAYLPRISEIKLPSLAPVQVAEIVAPSGEIICSQTLQLYASDDELSVFDLKTGCVIDKPDETSLNGNHAHAIILAEDLKTVSPPAPDANHPIHGQNKNALFFEPLGQANIRVAFDDGDVFCDIGSVGQPLRPNNVDGIQLRWEKEPERISGGSGIVSLQLPEGCVLRRVRKQGKTITARKKSGQRMAGFGQLNIAHASNQTTTWEVGPFQVTPHDHFNDVCMDLHIQHAEHPFRVRRRLCTPNSGVLWQRDNAIQEVDFAKPLHTAHAINHRFLVKLALPPDAAYDDRKVREHYREHALIEGGFFHRRLNETPKPLGVLHGFGQPLHSQRNVYNQSENCVKIANSVVDTGIIAALRPPDNDIPFPYLELYQPLYPPTDHHQVIIIRSNLSLASFPCELFEEKKNMAVGLPQEAIYGGYLAMGIFYNGTRLGSIWNNAQCDVIKNPPPDVEKLIRLIRFFKCPILHSRYYDASRQLIRQHIPAFVEAWLPENDNPIEIDGLKFKPIGLDEGSAYAFSEVMELDRLSLDEKLDAKIKEMVDSFILRY